MGSYWGDSLDYRSERWRILQRMRKKIHLWRRSRHRSWRTCRWSFRTFISAMRTASVIQRGLSALEWPSIDWASRRRTAGGNLKWSTERNTFSINLSHSIVSRSIGTRESVRLQTSVQGRLWPNWFRQSRAKTTTQRILDTVSWYTLFHSHPHHYPHLLHRWLFIQFQWWVQSHQLFEWR